MIVLKTAADIEKLRRANAVVVEVMQRIRELLQPGVSTLDLDRIAEEMIRARGGVPSFVGYHGYRHTLCTSVDHQVVHGIPNRTPLAAGQILSVDCGARIDGFHGDHAWTFFIGGTPPPDVAQFLRVSEEALYRGIAQMQVGARLFDISAAIQAHAEAHGYSIVRDFVGHGVGRELHEDPQVPNYGTAGTGLRLKAGIVLALEPMINMGRHETRILDDGWTVETVDGSLSTHFEHSVALTENGPEILSAW